MKQHIFITSFPPTHPPFFPLHFPALSPTKNFFNYINLRGFGKASPSLKAREQHATLDFILTTILYLNQYIW